MREGGKKRKSRLKRYPLIFKFNIDGAARSKPRPIGIGGLVRNSRGDWYKIL